MKLDDCKDIKDRIKYLRDDLNLSRAAFGENIGVSGDVINNIERGRVEVKELLLKMICKIYNVDYFWLTEGIGDPYIDIPETVLDEIIAEYNLDETDKRLIEGYINLSPEIRNALKTYLSYAFFPKEKNNIGKPKEQGGFKTITVSEIEEIYNSVPNDPAELEALATNKKNAI